ncbi:hypothetical protein GH714_036862 [Hevea brasiliensis]|uniref:Retrotransposon gag domain-containing protein n=1 Tax=Hevea brasiliensis TaxID=3981 RepID=A0A6A6MPB6_HEVBR|nr:hypothetical protein GH714_036862 [Hevea brasiliensis]
MRFVAGSGRAGLLGARGRGVRGRGSNVCGKGWACTGRAQGRTGCQPAQTRFTRAGSLSKRELRLLLKVTMADQSEITLGVGIAPMSVEHEGGRRKGRGKSRELSRAREDLGDLEKRLAKVELHLVEGEEKFEEMDTRLVELDGRMEELQGDMQGALNAAIDKLASEDESLCLSHMGECAALRDENRSLKEQLDKVVEENSYLRRELDQAMGKLKEVEQQVSLVAMAVARGGVATASRLVYLEQHFRAIGITDDAKKVDHVPLYLVDTAMVWWRWRHGDMQKGLCTIASWEEFKRELKRQFYPENVAHEARARLRRLSQKGSIRDYVKEFMETLLEIQDYPDAEALLPLRMAYRLGPK